MERRHHSKLGYYADKLAVKQTEPGLTTAQLMLINEDLKPGRSYWYQLIAMSLNLQTVEPERRKWGPWNFVGFWIADSFNIVSLSHNFFLPRDVNGSHLDPHWLEINAYPCGTSLMAASEVTYLHEHFQMKY
jgi:hypothetical protein